MPTPPLSLTPSRLRNPHRGTPTRSGGTQSYLEQSFANFNLPEMEYWIASGVVEQALAGKARSKRDYQASLMRLLLEATSHRHLPAKPSDDARLAAVVEVLWEGGAKHKTEEHEFWLKYAIGMPLADRLLDMGVDPWAITGTGIQGKHASLNAIEHGMTLLATAQHYPHWRWMGLDHDIDEDTAVVGLERRLDRCLARTCSSEPLLRSALAKTAEGMLQKHYTRKSDDRWRKWRGALLDAGARASLADNDALWRLAEAAHHRPAGLLDLAEARRKDETTEPNEEQTRQLLADLAEKRALRWVRVAREWIDALTPLLSTPKNETDGGRFHRNSSTAGAWERLINAPGVQDIAQDLARLLAVRGQPLPWTDAPPENQRENHDLTLLTTQDGRRSPRKIKALLALLALPEVQAAGVHPQWRKKAASQTLSYRAAASNDHRPPGLQTTEDPKDSTYVPSWSGNGWNPKLTSTEELTLLLALGGPRTQPGDDPEKDRSWVVGFLGQLPELWQDAQTPAEERTALLGTLDESGALGQILPELEIVGRATDDTNDTAACDQATGRLLARWYSGWTRAPEDNELLAQALEAGTQYTSAHAKGVRRMALWVRLMGIQQEASPFDQPLTDTPLARGLAQDPEAIYLFGTMITRKLEDISNQTKVMVHARSIQQLLAVGWEPPNRNHLAELVGGRAAKMATAPESHQELVRDTLMAIRPDDPVGEQTRFLETLMTWESHREENRLGWSHLAGLAVLDGARPTIDPNKRQPGWLTGAVGVAMDRRDLVKVARDERNEGLESKDKPKAARRF